MVAGTGSNAEAGGGKPHLTREEGIKKVKRVIGWYNKHGGLQETINYETVRTTIEAVKPQSALKILAEFEEKSGTIKNPTKWLLRALENAGPELDPKVRKTIAWLNKNAGLQEPIKYDELRQTYSWLAPNDACQLLKDLEGKASEIKNPTGYLIKAAANKMARDGPSFGAAFMQSPAAFSWFGADAGMQGGWPAGMGGGDWTRGDGPRGGGQSSTPRFTGQLDPRVKKQIGWYNNNGGLQDSIRFDEVAPLLAQVDPEAALKILSELDQKGATLRNPTGWLAKAVKNLMGSA